MKNTIRINFLMIAAVMISACTGSGGGNSSSTGGTNIPNTLDEKPLYNGAALTDAEKQQVRSIQQQTAVMPSPQLALISPRETTEQKEQREYEIAHLPMASKNIFNDIVNNCELQHPQFSHQGPQVPAAGDTASESQTAAIKGVNCHIGYNAAQNINMTFDEVSTVGNTVIYSVRSISDMTNELNILNTTLQNQVGFTKQVLTAKMQGLQNNKNGSYNWYQKLVGRLDITMTSGLQIPMDIYFEVLSKDTNREADIFQAYIELSMLVNNIKVVGQVYLKSSQMQFYVNGVASNVQEFSDLFGAVDDLIPH